eukprot:g5045.t1
MSSDKTSIQVSSTIAELHGGIRRSPGKVGGWVHRKPLSPDYETVGKTSMLHGGLIQRTKTREQKAKYAETLREQMRLKNEEMQRKKQNNLWSPPLEKDVRSLLNKLSMATEKTFSSSSLQSSPILPSPESSRRRPMTSPSGSFARFRHDTSPKDEREIRNEAKRKAKQTVLARNLREQSEMIRQRKLREKEIERMEQEAFEKRVEAQRRDILRKQKEKQEREMERRRRFFSEKKSVVSSPPSSVRSSSSSVRTSPRTNREVAPPIPTQQQQQGRPVPSRVVVQKKSIRSSLPSMSELVYDDVRPVPVKKSPMKMSSPMKIIHTTSTFVMPVEETRTTLMHQSLPSRSHFDVMRSSLGSGNGSETESGDEEEERRVVRSSPRPPPPSSKPLDGRFNVVRVSVEEIRSSIRRSNNNTDEAGKLPSRSVSSPVSSFTRKSNDTNETRRSEDSISSNFRQRSSNRSPSSRGDGRVLTLAQERALLKREEEQRTSSR